MSYFICKYGHVNKTEALGKSRECLTCGEKLETSPAIEALCTRYEARTFKVVECVYEEFGSVEDDPYCVVRGPIEGVLIVVVPNDDLRALNVAGRTESFVVRCTEVLKEAGWEGDVLFLPDNLKLARFEVEEL